MKDIILASRSPRRIELLKNAGINFRSVPADIDEDDIDIKDPGEFVKELSRRKALFVKEKYKESVVIGADTIVSFNDRILGKPKDKEDAFDMLHSLSGKYHSVFTGVSVCFLENNKAFETETFLSETKVKMLLNSDELIKRYIETKEPFDKAGAYGIQGKGMLLVESIEGDFYNVMGLPIARLFRLLSERNVI